MDVLLGFIMLAAMVYGGIIGAKAILRATGVCEEIVFPTMEIFTERGHYKVDAIRHAITYAKPRVFLKSDRFPVFNLVHTVAPERRFEPALSDSASPLQILKAFKDAVEEYERRQDEEKRVKEALAANRDHHIRQKECQWSTVESKEPEAQPKRLS